MPVPLITMRVQKYIPDRLYGFAVDSDGREVFFHLGVFVPGAPSEPPPQCTSCAETNCSWASAPAPPILGESVMVEVDFEAASTARAPRAVRVRRLEIPVVVRGRVESFDHYRGYGFIAGDDGTTYHLHKSEVLDGRAPLADQTVSFYAGIRQERPRACHVKVCP